MSESQCDVSRLSAALRVVADHLSGVLLHGLPDLTAAGTDERDSAVGRYEEMVAATQVAYAALAGVSVIEWTSRNPGIYDSPPGPITLSGAGRSVSIADLSRSRHPVAIANAASWPSGPKRAKRVLRPPRKVPSQVT